MVRLQAVGSMVVALVVALTACTGEELPSPTESAVVSETPTTLSRAPSTERSAASYCAAWRNREFETLVLGIPIGKPHKVADWWSGFHPTLQQVAVLAPEELDSEWSKYVDGLGSLVETRIAGGRPKRSGRRTVVARDALLDDARRRCGIRDI